MRGISIRAARPEDAGEIGAVHYRAWMQTYTAMLPESYLAARSAKKSTELFQRSECRDLVVAEADGQTVGFCGWGPFRDGGVDPAMGEIQGIYLLRAYQRMHLGQKMLAYALERLQSAGWPKAGLWVLSGNMDAIQFYEKMGFHPSGIQKTADLGKQVCELLYVKGLLRQPDHDLTGKTNSGKLDTAGTDLLKGRILG